MVFSSLLFLFLYLPAVILIYYITPYRYRNLFLFVVNLIFYGWGEPVFVLLMLFSTLVDYTHGYFIDKYRENKKIAKRFLVSAVVINLGLLGFFKYTGFLTETLNVLPFLNIEPIEIPLPIGISFYTFQTMSYSIDVYRGDAPVQKNIITFGTYVTLFPQLIAGPIVRYQEVAEQLDHRKETIADFTNGVKLFMVGLAKKVLIANQMGLLWDQLRETSQENGVLGSWIGICAYAFQIYFDFSGYSDMARGLGNMFGFEFLKNFDYPYISKTITEFWRRWHISLGTWFREYVYIPLGGNRKGLVRQIFNLLIVWFCTGFWHGASWNFLIWGGYYGVLLIMEKLFLLKVLKKIPAFFSHVYTLFFVVIGWVIFGFDDMTKGWEYLKGMFGFGGLQLVDNMSLYLLLSNLVLILILIVASTPLPAKLGRKIMSLVQTKTWAAMIIENVFIIAIFVVSVAFLVNSTYNPFLYFRF